MYICVCQIFAQAERRLISQNSEIEVSLNCTQGGPSKFVKVIYVKLLQKKKKEEGGPGCIYRQGKPLSKVDCNPAATL